MKKVNFKVLITDCERKYSSVFQFNEMCIADSYYNSKNFYCLQYAYVKMLYDSDNIDYIDYNAEKFHFLMLSDLFGNIIKPERNMDIYGYDINIAYLNVFTKEGYLKSVYKLEILNMEEIEEEDEMKDSNYLNTVLCNISDYNNKTSHDFDFEYITSSYHSNQDILIRAYMYFTDRYIEAYDSKNKYKKSAKEVIFNFVKDLFIDTGCYIKTDINIKNKDLDFMNLNIFNKEGYLVNTYKLKILYIKRTEIDYKDIENLS